MATPVRSREMSRLEGFSDAVFGFALTLLVVSLETPKDMAGGGVARARLEAVAPELAG